MLSAWLMVGLMWVGVKMMGHKDLNETFRTYAKYLPKDVKEATFLKEIIF